MNKITSDIEKIIKNANCYGSSGWYMDDDRVQLDGTFSIQVLRDIADLVERSTNVAQTKFPTNNTVNITKTHVVCPSCNKPAETIDHLSTFDYPINTRWWCDHCGEQYSLTVTKQNDKLIVSELKLTGNFKKPCLVLLKHNDIGLVVKDLQFDGVDGASNQEYFYNEHTCPTNYLSCVKEIFDLKNQDIDPHGIFEYITTLPYDERIDDFNNHEFKSELMNKFMKKNDLENT